MKTKNIDSRTILYGFTKSEKDLFEEMWNKLMRDKQNVLDLNSLSEEEISKAKNDKICYVIECIKLNNVREG